MITATIAKEFVYNWMSAWNRHEIADILDHYTNDVQFISPFISLLQFNHTGVITNKVDLRRYFEIGLKTYPQLKFKLHNYFIGINTVVIYYTSVNGRMATELFELDTNSKAARVYCNYATENAVYESDEN